MEMILPLMWQSGKSRVPIHSHLIDVLTHAPVPAIRQSFSSHKMVVWPASADRELKFEFLPGYVAVRPQKDATLTKRMYFPAYCWNETYSPPSKVLAPYS